MTVSVREKGLIHSQPVSDRAKWFRVRRRVPQRRPTDTPSLRRRTGSRQKDSLPGLPDAWPQGRGQQRRVPHSENIKRKKGLC